MERKKKKKSRGGKMAQISHGILVSVLPLFFLLFSSLPTSLAAPKKVAASARREDIPFIKCQVCDMLAHQIHHQVQTKQSKISPKKVSEFEIIEIAENVCNLKKQEADWILRIDVVEKGNALKLVDQGTEGQCNSECKTIEQTCQQVMGYLDTDVAEYIYTKKPSIDSLVKYLCHDLSRACSTKPPPVPKNRIPGEAFVPKSSKEAEMDRILKSMEGMPGAPNMKMYSRDDLLNMKGMGMGGENEDEDEDDEDDDVNFSSNLGNVLRERKSAKLDLKQRLVHGIKETGTTLKKHVETVTDRLRKWWKGKNKVQRTKSGKSEL